VRLHWVAIGVVAGGALALGCATIMQGTGQNVGIGSSPTGANVLVDGGSVGQTPVITRLSRKDNHIVRLELDGYQPFETALSRRVSGWVWGNIVFGGLIGLAVDALSGGLYKLTPDQIQAELQREGISTRVGDDVLLIAVTLRPSPQWERIGQLERTPEGDR